MKSIIKEAFLHQNVKYSVALNLLIFNFTFQVKKQTNDIRRDRGPTSSVVLKVGTTMPHETLPRSTEWKS